MAILFGVAGLFFLSHSRFIDFNVYYLGGRSLLSGREDLYNPDFSYGGVMDYRYPPFFLILFSPISLLPYFWAAYLWYWLNLLQIAGCLFFVRRLFELTDSDQKEKTDSPKIIWIISFFALAGYFTMSIKYGNVHLFVTFLLFGSFYFLARRKVLPAALMMALGITIKVMPLLALPYFALKKQWTYLTLVAAFVLAMNLAPSLVFGVDKNFQLLDDWFESVILHGEMHERLTVINLSLKGQLRRSLTDIDYSQRYVENRDFDVDYKKVNFAAISETAVNQIWLAAAAVLYALSLLLIWFKSKTNIQADDKIQLKNGSRLCALELGLIVCLILLVSPLTSKIYFVMLLLPVYSLANSAFRTDNFPAKMLRAVLIFVAAANALLPLLPGRAVQRLLLVIGADFYITLLLFLTFVCFFAAESLFAVKRSSLIASKSI